MAEENFEENLNQPKMPVSEITIRTMDSDIKAIEQGGGEMAAPKPFVPVSPIETEVKTGFNIPGYTGPEKAIFSPGSIISSKEPLVAVKSTNRKTILIIIVVLLIVVGFGLLGYFVIAPWLFPPQMPAVQ